MGHVDARGFIRPLVHVRECYSNITDDSGRRQGKLSFILVSSATFVNVVCVKYRMSIHTMTDKDIFSFRPRQTFRKIPELLDQLWVKFY